MPPESENNTASPTTESAVEAEIRRQVMAERARELQASGYRPGPLPPLPSTSTSTVDAPPPGWLQRWKNSGGILGGLASVILLLLKLKSVLFALKFIGIFKTLLITGGSMLLSLWGYALLYGWGFGAAVVLMIFIHECGHAFAGHLRGKPWGIMMFVPFMGAFVTIRGGKDAAEDAFIGIAGPIAGTLTGIASYLIYAGTGSPFWLAVASTCFFMNLFNLAPVAPLDGGWIVPLFSPRILAVTSILLLPLAYYNPLIIFLAAASLPRIISGWNVGKPNAKVTLEQAAAAAVYFRVSKTDKWRYGIAYFGLIAFLFGAYTYTHNRMTTNHTRRAPVVPLQLSV